MASELEPGPQGAKVGMMITIFGMNLAVNYSAGDPGKH